MPTTTPIPESILANVATVLATITTTASYRNTVATVNRQFINPETLGNGTKLPALCVFSEMVEWEPMSIASTPNQLGFVRFKVQGIMKTYGTAAPATNLLKLVQDVREALLADRTRGGYAMTTTIKDAELGGEGVGNSYGSPPFVAKPFYGFLMSVECEYTETL